ncbi:MAG: diguanylate phosphodiesterase, partial [Pygmaiobacter sp.]
MQKKSKRHKPSILTKMLLSMLLSLVLMFTLLSGTIFFGGMTEQLRVNAFDILDERVAGRRDNLEGEMVQRWSNLGESVQDINRESARVLKENNADYSDLTADSPISGALLEAISGRLAYQLRRSSATGIFLILNGDADSADPQGDEVQQRAGIYLRDYDPDTSPADDSDFMLERAPMAFVKNHNITLDTYWQPIFTFRANEKNDYYYQPYRAALTSHTIEAENLGYWGAPDVLDPNGTPAITYSLPLLAEDGTPYGVLGVEMTLDYVVKKLPYTEINGNVQGSYVLAKKNRGASEFETLISSGPYFKNVFGSECETLTLSNEPVCGDSYRILTETQGSVYGCVQYLELYNSNTPFEQEQWAILGVIQDDNLLGLYHSVLMFLVLTLLIAFAIGVASILFTSVRL